MSPLAATQGAKRDAIAGRRVEVPPTLRFAAADLDTVGLPAKYLGSGSTLVVMEGLLMYLREDSIHALFDTLRQAPCRHLQVIFSFMERWPDGSCGFRPRSWWIDRWVARRGEPFTWSIETDRLPGFLAARGFELTRLATTRELADPPGGTLEGENLALCQRYDLSPGL